MVPFGCVPWTDHRFVPWLTSLMSIRVLGGAGMVTLPCQRPSFVFVLPSMAVPYCSDCFHRCLPVKPAHSRGNKPFARHFEKKGSSRAALLLSPLSRSLVGTMDGNPCAASATGRKSFLSVCVYMKSRSFLAPRAGGASRGILSRPGIGRRGTSRERRGSCPGI